MNARRLIAAATVWAVGLACGSDDAVERKDPPAVSAAPAQSDAPPFEGTPAGRWHEVKAGDTLWSIAQRARLPVEELTEINGLDSPEQLAVGQLIFVPSDNDTLGLDEGETPRAGTLTRHRGPVDTSADLAWPLELGVLLRDFDATGPVPYDGILLAAPEGTPVFAADNGKVLHVAKDQTSLGTVVIVRHPSGLMTIYAHLASTTVQRGQAVARGMPLGTVGTTGRAESPMVHFQVRDGRTPVDPLEHLPAP